jgi:hypothetical protein
VNSVDALVVEPGTARLRELRELVALPQHPEADRLPHLPDDLLVGRYP